MSRCSPTSYLRHGRTCSSEKRSRAPWCSSSTAPSMIQCPTPSVACWACCGLRGLMAPLPCGIHLAARFRCHYGVPMRYTMHVYGSVSTRHLIYVIWQCVHAIYDIFYVAVCPREVPCNELRNVVCRWQPSYRPCRGA